MEDLGGDWDVSKSGNCFANINVVHKVFVRDFLLYNLSTTRTLYRELEFCDSGQIVPGIFAHLGNLGLFIFLDRLGEVNVRKKNRIDLIHLRKTCLDAFLHLLVLKNQNNFDLPSLGLSTIRAYI